MTTAEIETMITNIDTAILAVVTGGKSYTISDGHGSQTVTRSSLGELRKMKDYYLLELDSLNGGTCYISTGGKSDY